MRLRWCLSGLLAFLMVASLAGQSPPGGAPKTADKDADKADPRKKPPIDPVQQKIAAALAHDPDVRMARAKLQLAEAELSKARQSVAQKVTTLLAAVEEHHRAVRIAMESLAIVEQRVRVNAVHQGEMPIAREKVAVAEAAYSRAQMELKLATGEAGQLPGELATAVEALYMLASQQQAEARVVQMTKLMEQARAEADVARRMAESRVAVGGDNLVISRPNVAGPVAERLRATLDRPVKLGDKGREVKLSEAMALFKKEAGFDVPFRAHVAECTVVSEGETLPIGAWLQMYQDNGGGVLYIREYGLLFTIKQNAPADAMTLNAFWAEIRAKPTTSPLVAPPKKAP